MNIINEMIVARDTGSLKITFLRNHNYSIEYILEMLGFSVDYHIAKSLIKINKTEAIRVISTVLNADLAYNSTILDMKTANEFATEFVETYLNGDFEIYTNGKWWEWFESEYFEMLPMTRATFDAGLLAINEHVIISLWVEDED